LVVHTAYNSFLLNTYRLGEFNQVYPIARGTAPLVVALVSVPIAGERLHFLQFVGLAVIAGCLFGLANLRSWWADGRPPAVAWAFGTGLFIATYSVVDGLGVRHSDRALGYAAWLTAADMVPIPLYALLCQRTRVRTGWSSSWRPAAIGGVLAAAAYTLVLWAQSRGALGVVAALRETSVLFAALIGSALFGDSFGRRRACAATGVVLGVVLLSVS
jgi:drug/metabolite transporter (DMT)-like permease